MPPLLLLLLLLLQTQADPGPDPGPSPGPGPGPEWHPVADGSAWLAALDAADANVSSPSPTVRSSCTDACDLELLRRERIEVVKLKLLGELGLESPPEGRGREVAAEFLDRVVGEQKLVNLRNRRELKLQTDNAETKTVWTLAKHSPLAGHSPMRDSPLAAETIYFELPRDLTAHNLGSARVLLRPEDRTGPLTYTGTVTYVNLYKVVSQGFSYQLEEFSTETVQPKTTSSQFASIDVTELVYSWIRSPDKNYGLVIRTRDQHGAGSSTLFHSLRGAGSSPAEEKTPLLEVHIENSSSKRRKWRRRRRAPHIRFCDPNGKEKDCCLYELVVDFHEFGWDWIIAPVRYHANFCRGDCPAVYLQKFAHTHIAQQMGGNVGPCCSPRQLAPLWMLHWDNKNNIKYVQPSTDSMYDRLR